MEDENCVQHVVKGKSKLSSEMMIMYRRKHEVATLCSDPETLHLG